MTFPRLLVAILVIATWPKLSHADDLSSVTGIDAGLAIHLGTTDGQIEIELARNGSLVIHGLTNSSENLAAARAAIAAEGRYGLASVGRVESFAKLPYADNLANLIVADLDLLGPAAPPREEIDRVIAPMGVTYLKQNGKWHKHVAPLPDDVDQWQHWDYGPAGNPASNDQRIAPTTSLRWLAGMTNVDGAGSKVGLRLSDGQVYYTGIKHELAGRFRREGRNDLFARDAFNGTLRWRRKIEGVPGGGDQPPRFALTAADGRVYCYPEVGGPLHALDAETGETLVTFDEAPAAPPVEGWNKWQDPVSKIHFVVRVFGNRVMQSFADSIYLSDATTGKLIWKQSFGEKSAVGWAVVGGDRIYAAVADRPLIKNRASHITPTDRIVALDVSSGKQLWSYDGLKGFAAFRIVFHRESVIVPAFSIEGLKPNFGKNPIVVRLDAQTGDETWRSTPKAESRGHYTIAMARGDEVIVGQQNGFGLDFATGELTHKYGWGQHDNSCADLKCVPGFTLYGLTFIDDDGNRITRGQTRTVCDVGLFPAYGLLYGSPLGCLCSEYVNGYSALSAESLRAPMPDDQRLTRGEAFGKVPHIAPQVGDRKTDEWPLHMADARRSNWSSTQVDGELTITWKSELTKRPEGVIARDWNDNEKIVGQLTAPTVAAGKVFVAAADAHRLEALDAASGEPLWSFTTGGRIDSPPTIIAAGDDALCLLGSRDGYVYCLRASDGALVWKFLAAASEKLIAVQSQLESAWPVFGSIMVDDGGLLVTAGRQSAIDGGIRVYKLRPHDGSILWQTRIWTDPDATAELEDNDLVRSRTRNRRVNELLVHDGRQAAMWITPLATDYQADELVNIENGVYSARAMRFSLPSKDELREIDYATWIRSGGSNGLLSRRTDSVGRFDEEGVAYAALKAEKIVLADHTGDRPSRMLYALQASADKSRNLNGGLVAVRLNDDGTPAEKPRLES